MVSLEKIQVYSQKQVEAAVTKFWEEKQVPNHLAKMRAGAKPFYLLDGPPYVNNSPHVGTLKTTVCKDVWSRFKYMQGFNVYYQPGFDCHGLPVEVIVEKELGIQSKADIEKMGVEKFDKACLQKVLNNEGNFIDTYKLLGAWRGWFNPYFTYKDYYIESAWWTVKQIHDKGLLVEGEKAIHWCPHCETALSGYEVSDSYKDIKAPSIYLKFRVKGTDNEYLLAWTTTPWTLPANVALAVHPEETYVRIKVGADILIVAEKRLQPLAEEIGIKYEVLSKVKGSELEGVQYEPLLDLPIQRELDETSDKAHRVILSLQIMANKKYKKHVMKAEAGKEGSASTEATANEQEEFEEFVTMDSGSGIVHTAPGHGQTDNFIGRHYGLPQVCPVDEHGLLTEKAGEFAGLYTSKADPIIIEHLDQHGKLLNADYFMHRAAVCWRCKTPLIFRLSPQWYMKVDPIKEEILAHNEKINWMPEFGRVKFQNWIADREDWCLSQQRYWGIPIPIWVCSKCGAKRVIGSRKELCESSIEKLDPAKLTDLHRHAVDSIQLNCHACGDGKMTRVRDIFTVWFDSGIAPWASLGYPFQNKELFEQMFPTSLVCEAQDQIRGWFDSLMLCSMAAFGKKAYEGVALMGWVLDEKGEKMSKSLGNVIVGKDGVDQLTADGIRLYYCSEIAPWEVQNFSVKTAKEGLRDLSILWNVLSFYQMYQDAALPKIDLQKQSATLAAEDRWILSRLNSTATKAAEHIDKFEFHLAGRALKNFVVDDLSRWYVKLIRDRVALTAPATDRATALTVLRTCIIEAAKLFAPITPFIAEYAFQQLKSDKDEESVHFARYPRGNQQLVDAELEEQMLLAMQITEAANSARQEAGIKLRWPIAEVVVAGDNKTAAAVQRLNEVLKATNNSLAVRALKEGELPEQYAIRDAYSFKVAIPKELTDELKNQALLRELARAIQDARKKGGFNVRESIELTLSADAKTAKFLEAVKGGLAKEVGAISIALVASEDKLNGENKAGAELGDRKVLAAFKRK